MCRQNTYHHDLADMASQSVCGQVFPSAAAAAARCGSGAGYCMQALQLLPRRIQCPHTICTSSSGPAHPHDDEEACMPKVAACNQHHVNNIAAYSADEPHRLKQTSLEFGVRWNACPRLTAATCCQCFMSIAIAASRSLAVAAAYCIMHAATAAMWGTQLETTG
jgi:hypothetical protein